jgi:hypothetical protein
MLSLALKRLRDAAIRSRIFTETGVPSSASVGFMLLWVFINIVSYYQR